MPFFSWTAPRTIKSLNTQARRRGQRSGKLSLRFRPVLEQLEERRVLSGGQFLTWGGDNITAPYTLNEILTGPYTLNLYASPDVAPSVSGWTIDWGDGSPAQAISGNPETVTHEFPILPLASFNITAQAHTSAGTFAANTGPGSVLLEPLESDPWFHLRYPQALAFDGAGNLYVANRDGDDVVRFDSAGNYLGVFIPTGDHGLDQPRGMTFNAVGELFITNAPTDEVFRYTSAGVFQDKFVPAGSGGLDDPRALTFGPDGALYVGSTATNQILRYDGATGAPLGAFVAAGSAGLNIPSDMVFGPDGHLYVSSASTDQVLRYDGSSGAPIGSGVFVSAGSGGLDVPRGLAFGPDGNLFVVSGATESVLRYDGATGGFLDIYVAPGAGVLDNPNDLLFDAGGDLLLASSSSEAVVHISGPLAPAPPEPVPTVAAYLPFRARLVGDGWEEADGGAKDMSTGLVWSTDLGNDKGTGNFDFLPTAADAMIDAGYTDWRIPTKAEMVTAFENGAGTHVDLQGYNFFRWSSTDAGRIKGIDSGWVVNLETGETKIVPQANSWWWVVVRDTLAKIGSLSDSPDAVTQGSTMTLTANNVTAVTAKVDFYRDTNNNGVLNVGTDLLLGTDTSGADGWKLAVPIPGAFPTGTYRYFAQAADANNVWGNEVSTTNTVQKAKGKTSPSSTAISGLGDGLVLLSTSSRGTATAPHDDEYLGTSNALSSNLQLRPDPRAVAHVLANYRRLEDQESRAFPHESDQPADPDIVFEGGLDWIFRS